MWNSKVDKVKRNVITKGYEDGGIRMINIQNLIFSFRLRWLSRIVDDTVGCWKEFALFYLETLGDMKLVLNCTIDKYIVDRFFIDKVPTFYFEIIQAWAQLRELLKKDDIYSNSQILWFNKYVLYDKEPLFYKDWYNSSIIFLRDLCIEGKFLSLTKLNEKLESSKAKAKALFDYSKLRSAIPRVWLSNLKDSVFDVPKLHFMKKEKDLRFCSTKLFYEIILKDGGINPGPKYWMNLMDGHIKLEKHIFDKFENYKRKQTKAIQLENAL